MSPVIDLVARRRQSAQALELANRVRLARSAQKRRLAALPKREGQARAAALLVDPPAELVAMPVGQWLASIHRWSELRAGRLLRSERVSPLRPIGALTDREAAALAGRLRTGPEAS